MWMLMEQVEILSSLSNFIVWGFSPPLPVPRNKCSFFPYAEFQASSRRQQAFPGIGNAAAEIQK